MSSRVYSGPAADARGIVWRSTDDPHTGAVRRDMPSKDDTGTQAAYDQGFEAGKAAAARVATQHATTQLAPVLASLGAVVKELAGVRKRFRTEAEEATVNLAIAIARRVLHREIAVDPEAIVGLVRSGFDRLNAREVHRLRVSPGDAAVLQENRMSLDLPPAVEIVVDPSLIPGGAIFETSSGEMDASVTTQLDEIQRGFADLVRRRK